MRDANPLASSLAPVRLPLDMAVVGAGTMGAGIARLRGHAGEQEIGRALGSPDGAALPVQATVRPRYDAPCLNQDDARYPWKHVPGNASDVDGRCADHAAMSSRRTGTRRDKALPAAGPAAPLGDVDCEYR